MYIKHNKYIQSKRVVHKVDETVIDRLRMKNDTII